MAFAGSPNNVQDVYQYAYGNSQNVYGNPYITETSVLCHSEESNFWSSSPRSDSPSSGIKSQASGGSPYQMYATLSFSPDEGKHSQYRSGYSLGPIHSEADSGVHLAPPFVRVVKRRSTANKKERRRTQSINNSYAALRDCIPNVPADTKLSKIKTLRLATSYISYLTGVLETDDPAGGFKAELGNSGRRSSGSSSIKDCSNSQPSPESSHIPEDCGSRRAKGRTGWPQHVWALELKQEQTL
ncbi:heart- and neural crest derivatives-expressed protein 1 [Agrilus planipennis]|uniref:Heart- and neural crest derivatives-expressed protein 1 n=1 Tax=Agrilus planipennis TaxID=224129 RepID=A0A1W4WRG2_AGRPL|nr:heart- and neural crest derivatives-expressed protein 1 [Agrilus planipennis]